MVLCLIPIRIVHAQADRRGSNLTLTFVFVVCQMAFRWRADNGPTLNAGLVVLRFSRGSGPVLLRNHMPL